MCLGIFFSVHERKREEMMKHIVVNLSLMWLVLSGGVGCVEWWWGV